MPKTYRIRKESDNSSATYCTKDIHASNDHYNNDSWWRDMFILNWLFNSNNHSRNNSSRDSDSKTGTLGAMLVLLVVAFSGIILGALGAIEALEALRNIFRNKQIVRNLYTLLGAAVGSYLGVFSGIELGIWLAPLVPGLGLTAGMVIGAMFCAGIGLCVGTYFCKWTGMLISYIVYGETNPGKWQLTSQEKQALHSKNVSPDFIQEILNSIKTNSKNNSDLIYEISSVQDTILSPAIQNNTETVKLDYFIECLKAQIHANDTIYLPKNPETKIVIKTVVLQPVELQEIHPSRNINIEDAPTYDSGQTGSTPHLCFSHSQ